MGTKTLFISELVECNCVDDDVNRTSFDKVFCLDKDRW